MFSGKESRHYAELELFMSSEVLVVFFNINNLIVNAWKQNNDSNVEKIMEKDRETILVKVYAYFLQLQPNEKCINLQ